VKRGLLVKRKRGKIRLFRQNRRPTPQRPRRLAGMQLVEFGGEQSAAAEHGKDCLQVWRGACVMPSHSPKSLARHRDE